MKMQDLSIYDSTIFFVIGYDQKFESDSWRFQWSRSDSEYFSFKSENKKQVDNINNYEDLVTILKVLTYYSLPCWSINTVNSWSTAKSRYNSYKLWIEELFIENRYTNRKFIKVITPDIIRKAIKKHVKMAKYNSRSLRLLYAAGPFFRTWTELTEQELLPAWMRFDYTLSMLMPTNILRDISSAIDENTGTWEPLESIVIDRTFNLAIDYIDEYSESILEVYSKIINRPLFANGKIRHQIRSDGKTKEIFNWLNTYRAPLKKGVGEPLFRFMPVTRSVASGGYVSGYQDRTTIRIDFFRSQILLLRNACLFIIGLLTGLRLREIRELKAKPAYLKDDVWYLEITRFKTTSDAIEGIPDSIPVPPLVVKAINILITLLKRHREDAKSEYLVLSDRLTGKNFDRLDKQTLGRNISEFIYSASGAMGHTHQLRKSIAWLLISRSENNLDILRQLFGHKSYSMTIRYILRNELLSEGVLELIEHNYSEDLKLVINDIKDGTAYSASSKNIRDRNDYSGKILVSDIKSIVHTSLNSGIPLYVSRLPIGGFCVTDELFYENKPPCISGTDSNKPDPTHCNYIDCPYIVYNKETYSNVVKQIQFYKMVLQNIPDEGSEKLIRNYEKIIGDNEKLLCELSEGLTTVGVSNKEI